jgi:hypothetical protein
MKKSLVEQLSKIHRLNYGKPVSENILDKIFGKKEENPKKTDDPKKADLVSDDVAEFFKTLENINTEIKQQQSGSYQYQKDVETIQIALILLGYELPRFGIDGLYGPETANAVAKFKKDNSIEDKSEVKESISLMSMLITELEMVQLDDTSYSNVKFDNDATRYDEVNKALLDDLQKAGEASGVVLTITTAKSGHGYHTISGRKSRHMSNIAVDIAILNGVSAKGASGPNNGNPQFREFGNKLKDALVQLGYTWNTESGNDKAVLWQTNTGGNHYNHLHVSNKSGASDAELDRLSFNSGSILSVETIKVILEKLKQRGVTSEELKKLIDIVTTGGSAEFTDLDLSTDEGYKKYAAICQKFIDSRQPNPLGITGEMLAKSARNAFERHRKYIPPELSLSQLALEGGIGNGDLNSRPIRTKNPYNVGNTDSGDNVFYNDVQGGIERYYDLIARRYLVGGKTAKDLITNFVNKNGNRYASGVEYERGLTKLAAQANRMAQNVV